MVYAQPRICPGEWHAQTPLGFWDSNGSLNIGQTTWPCYEKEYNGTSRIAFLADHIV